jgi:hypothetical protein
MTFTVPLNTLAADMLTYSQLYQLRAVLTRIQTNLTLTNKTPNSQVIMIATGNLFQLAAQYYGDATQWALIANANNIVDPFITSLTSLVIPPLNNVSTGGLISWA